MSRAADRAYDGIRSMILSGELPAGAQLGEEALAELCGVSRTPVRDALRRLESELLDWSLGDVADAFELRGMLESHAARRAAERMDDVALQKLRGCNHAILRAVQASPPDIMGFLEGNRDFHAIILEVAGSRRLAALLGGLIEQPVVWRTAHHYTRAALLRSHGDHDELLAAFSRHDGAWAEAVMAGHIRRAFHAYSDAHQGLATIEGAG